jgi:hypothetical protein
VKELCGIWTTLTALAGKLLRARNAADPAAAVENFFSTVEVFILRNFPQNK